MRILGYVFIFVSAILFLLVWRMADGPWFLYPPAWYIIAGIILLITGRKKKAEASEENQVAEGKEG